MSNVVHYKGILFEVHPTEGKTIQEMAQQLFKDEGHEMSGYDKEYLYRVDWVRTLCSYSENYLTFNYKLYQIKKVGLDPNDDIIRASLNEDGSIDFEVKFYNGGASIQEAIESALKKLDL
jgi:hypothetical protein